MNILRNIGYCEQGACGSWTYMIDKCTKKIEVYPDTILPDKLLYTGYYM